MPASNNIGGGKAASALCVADITLLIYGSIDSCLCVLVNKESKYLAAPSCRPGTLCIQTVFCYLEFGFLFAMTDNSSWLGNLSVPVHLKHHDLFLLLLCVITIYSI